MSRSCIVLAASVLLIGIVAMFVLPVWGEAPFHAKSGKSELHREASARLAKAITAMDQGLKALSAGEKDKAAAEFQSARQFVQETQDSFLKYAPGVKR